MNSVDLGKDDGDQNEVGRDCNCVVVVSNEI